jgi:hypothetical protein
MLLANSAGSLILCYDSAVISTTVMYLGYRNPVARWHSLGFDFLASNHTPLSDISPS